MPTPKQLLVEHIYDGDLPADIQAMVTAGSSWREIAEQVSTKTGQRVSHESLRQWYGKATSEAVA